MQQANCAIVFCINYCYWPHAAVAIRSVLVNSQHHSIPIVIIYDRPDQAWISRIALLCRLYHVQLRLIKFDTSIVADFKVFGRLSSATYFRLYAPRILPEYEKLLYLDADIVVMSDLFDLFQADLASYAIAARSFTVIESSLMNQRLQRESDIPYFNAGVLLIRSRLWEEMSCTEHISKIILNESERLCYADQCALNLFFGDSYKSLPLEWNVTRAFFESDPDSHVYTSEEVPMVKSAISRPKIIHYTGDYKPWHIQCKHPLRQIYWKHRSYYHWYPYVSAMQVLQSLYLVISRIKILYSASKTLLYNPH